MGRLRSGYVTGSGPVITGYGWPSLGSTNGAKSSLRVGYHRLPIGPAKNTEFVDWLIRTQSITDWLRLRTGYKSVKGLFFY